eukprot:SAG31_NODE_43620_length_266_cov_0.802395_1_plen_43_part_01
MGKVHSGWYARLHAISRARGARARACTYRGGTYSILVGVTRTK